MSDEHLICGRATCEKCIDDAEKLDALRTECERLRGVLERLGQEPCAFDGSYANCWEAIEADDIDAGEGIPCARCVSLQALETATPRTGAPVLDPVALDEANMAVLNGCPTKSASGLPCAGCLHAAARIRSLASRPPRGGSHAE